MSSNIKFGTTINILSTVFSDFSCTGYIRVDMYMTRSKHLACKNLVTYEKLDIFTPLPPTPLVTNNKTYFFPFFGNPINSFRGVKNNKLFPL